MIAFSLGSLHIYRYGIFYAIAFLVGYIFFMWVVKKELYKLTLPRVHEFLKNNLDTLMIYIFLWVLIGGRLGHIVIYSSGYYRAHPIEILQIWKGGMSFIGGIFGVIIALVVLAWKHHLTFKDLLWFGDAIFAILPFGIMLGRIGNFLNQELYGIVVSDWLPRLWYPIFSLLNDLHIFHVYPQIDSLLRLNTNFLSSFFEWFVLLIITLSIIRTWAKTKVVRPGRIVGVFLVGYSFVRFLLEYVRADSQLEFQGRFSISQYFFLGFFIVGIGILRYSYRTTSISTK